MKKKEMPYHIFVHSMSVRRLAVVIALHACKRGYDISMPVVDRAAILHDICKIDSIRSGGDHALMGEQLLREYGYPLVADVVGQHVRLKTMQLNEAMIVNYADKRVMHKTIVSLDKRFVDLMHRYGTCDEAQDRILWHYYNSLKIQDLLVSCLDIDPPWLENLNLIPGDYPFYCGHRILGEHGPVEKQYQDINLERVDENQPVLVDERNLFRGRGRQ